MHIILTWIDNQKKEKRKDVCTYVPTSSCFCLQLKQGNNMLFESLKTFGVIVP